MTELDFRPMYVNDFRQVLSIEEDQFDFPWTRDDLWSYMTTPGVVCSVVVLDDEVIAYSVFEFRGARVHLHNIAVDLDYQRRGIGSLMLDAIKAHLSSRRRARVTATVRETNLPAQLFFKANGFAWIATRKGVYDDTAEDAYRMAYRAPVTARVVTQGCS